jgi:hypothetical protein
VGLYKAWIREPIIYLAQLLLPNAWFPLPTFWIDALVIWLATHLALQSTYYRLHGTPFIAFHIKSRIEDYKQVTGMHRIALLVLAPLVIAIDISTLLMAPLIIPFVALVDYVQTRNEYAWRLLRFYFLFLVSLAGIILVFMNINLQLK